ncbi:MAG: endolytic transglycosylase MltG [Myxococcota bacterium]
MKRALWGAVALIAVAAMAGAAWTVNLLRRMDAPFDRSAPAQVLRIPKGASGQGVARLLEKEGLIEDRLVYRALLMLQPDGPSAKAGRHEVSAAMSPKALRQRLGEAPLPEDAPFTVVEGWRLQDTDRALAGLGLISQGEYIAAASKPDAFELPFDIESATLEGYAYPETYAFVRDRFDLHGFIQRQLDTFVEKFYLPYRDSLSRDLHTIVVIASMLEREEPKPSVRPMVAGVMYNRLDGHMPLGVDATSRYTLEVWNDRQAFLRKLRDTNDPYNTRLRVGLPPTAIGAPTVESLRAAAGPADVPFLYYLHDDSQQIHFARTAAQHEANRRKYNVW